MKREDKRATPGLLSLLEFVEKWKGGCCMAGKMEREFQALLIKELKELFEGCIVTKLDSSHLQGIPDLLILYKNKWATLECKKFNGAKKQPNQKYYVGLMNKMSFSRFICPENKEEVLNELQQAFKPRRATRLSGSK